MGRVDGWRYCPRCASGLHIDGRRAECPACGFVAYSGSEPTVCALVVDEVGRLLVARRAHDPGRGKWDLPGGFLEEGEEPLDGLRRELLEETGLDVEPAEFFGAFVDRYGDADDAPATLNLYWTARALGGEPQPADDVAELAWLGADELPPDDEIAFRNVALVLHAWRDSR